MNQRQLASVLFAVVGLFIVIFRLPELFVQGAMIAQWGRMLADPGSAVDPRSFLVASTIGLLLMVVIGTGLLVFRDRLAGMLFSAAGAPLAARDVHAVGLSVVGAFLVVHSLRALTFPGPSRWAGVVQILLGTGLFLGATRISALWAALGSTGVSGDRDEGSARSRPPAEGGAVPLE
jgi:hypothetical protein